MSATVFHSNEPTVSEIVRAYLADQENELNRETFKRRKQVGEWFCRDFGDRLPSTIYASELKQWIMARWPAPTTRWGMADLLKRFFNWAVIDRRIVFSPIKGLHFRPGEPRAPVSDEDFQAMLAVSDDDFAHVLMFLRATGCRPGELRVLRWEWVRWDERIVIIPPAFHKTGKRTGKPRVIVLPDVAHDLLGLLHLERCSCHELIFTNTYGRPWTGSAMGQRLMMIRRRTGLPLSVTLHGLRHSFGTTAVRNGANLKMLSVAMGHTSTRVTEKYYVHVQDDTEGLRRAANLGLTTKEAG